MRCGLKRIDVPQGVTFIDMQAFTENHDLKTVTLPSSLTEMGYIAFGNIAPDSVTCLATVPPEASYAFMFSELSDATLTVPSGSEEAYKAAPGWKDFYNITAAIHNPLSTLPAHNTADHPTGAVYGTDGTRRHNLMPGLNIVDGRKVIK